MSAQAALILPLPHVYSAVLSDDGRYRYELTRAWDSGRRLVWVMLNPSIADAETDDPTIRRVRNFTRAWGYPGFTVVNLFGLRATDPAALKTADDPVGPENDQHILEACQGAPVTVAAWGTHGLLRNRGQDVLAMLASAGIGLHCLGRNIGGNPRHPLYVAAAKPLEPYGEERARAAGEGKP